MDKRRLSIIGVALVAAVLLSGCQSAGGLLGDGAGFASAGGTDKKLYLSVITGLQSSGQSRAALAYLDDYEQKFPGDPQAQMLRGEALVSTGDAAGAEAIFEGLIKRGYTAQGYAGMGKANAQREQWQQAAWYFQKASVADPANAKLLNNLGFALLKNYRAGEAYGPLARANELDRNSSEIRNNLLLAEYWGNRREAAMARIDRIEQADERAAVLQFVTGWNASGGARNLTMATTTY